MKPQKYISQAIYLAFFVLNSYGIINAFPLTSNVSPAGFHSVNRIDYDPRGVPRYISGDLISGVDLTCPHDLYRIFGQIQGIYGITRTMDEFKTIRLDKDRDGFEHARMQQYYCGIPVKAGELILHTDASHTLNAIDGRFLPGIALDVHRQSITKEEAIQTAIGALGPMKFRWLYPESKKSDYKGKNTIDSSLYPNPQLMIVCRNGDDDHGEYRLAWNMHFYVDNIKMVEYDIAIDAFTGDLLLKNAVSMDYATTGHSTFYYTNTYDKTVNIQLNSTHQFVDSDKNIEIRDWSTNDIIYSQTVPVPNTDTMKFAVDVLWALEQTWSYYLNVHGWEGYDGKNSLMKACINWFDAQHNSPIENAEWDTSYHRILVGGGISPYSNPFSSIDVMAHEFTHGVLRSKISFGSEGEAQALNEGFADIFGECVEDYVSNYVYRHETNSLIDVDWKHGEDIAYQPNDQRAIRHLEDPWISDLSEVPAGARAYLGQHWSSTDPHARGQVLSYAFYLMVHGGSGTNEFGYQYDIGAIPMYVARQLAFKALNHLSSEMNFYGAMNAFLQAAIDMGYAPGSQYYNSVGEAFAAVNVGLCLYAKNNYDIGNITINVHKGNLNTTVTQVSGAKFYSAPEDSVTISAIEQQAGQYHYVWNTTGNLVSQWEQQTYGQGATPISNQYNNSYIFSPVTSDNKTTYIAGLRRQFNIIRLKQMEFDGTVSDGVVAQCVEQNQVTITAPLTCSGSLGAYHFGAWTDGTPVDSISISPADNSSVTAYYKLPMRCDAGGNAMPMNQRKLLMTADGTAHIVYQSGGDIWYARNSGSGWSNEYSISFSGAAKDPTIGATVSGGVTTLHLVWEDATYLGRGIKYRSSTDYGNTWQTDTIISGLTFLPAGIDADPVIGGDTYPIICWRWGDGSAYGGLAVFFNCLGTQYITELISNAPHACSPAIYGSDPVQLAYAVDGVAKYMEFSFGPTPGNPSISYTDTLPMPGESRGANPSIITSGLNTYVVWDAVKSNKRHVFLTSRSEEGDWSTPIEFTYGSDTLSKPFLSYDNKMNHILLGWQCDSSDLVARVSHPRLTGSWSPVAVVGNGRGLQIASNGNQSYANNAWISGSSAPFTINTTTESAPGSPQLASPSNGAVDQSRTPTLNWNYGLDAEKYHLQVSANRAFSGTPAYENTSVTGDSQSIPSNYILLYHTKYYWRVSSKNYIGEGSYSSVDSFTTVGTAGNASMASQSAAVTGSNGQRKVIRDCNRFLHFVYDSSGAIYYGQSTNNGSSWVYPAKISGTLTNCGQPAITERAETLYVVFGRNISSNTWDVDYTYSADGGFNWKTTPVQNASSISCPGAGPLPVTQVSSPSDPFELLIAYQRSVDIRTSYTTTRPTISSNWTTITLDGSDSASVTPTLGYDCHSGSGNFYILTKRISQLRLQRFYYTSWDNPGFNYANGSFSGYVYYLSYPTLAYTSNNVEWVAFEGYHQAYYDDVILALKNRNTSQFTEFYDQNYYNHHYHRPVMSGLSGSRAVLLWAADTTSVTKVIYNGSSWGSPTGWGSNNNYPTVTISNPPGDTAFAFWRSGTSAPYSITTNSNGGPLYKTTAPMTYSRRLDIQDKRSGNIVSLDLAPPEFDDGLASVSLPFVETDDDSVYTVGNIWQALQTEPVTLGNVASDEMTSIRRIAIHVKNASVSESPVQLRFEAVDAQNGAVRATENVSLSETDTTLSGEDEMSLDVGQLSGHKVFFRLVPVQSLNDSDYTVALGHIYCFNDSSASNKSGSKRRDRFAQQKPVEFALFANYPNPFNPVTNVDYALPERAIVRVAVYNTAGQEVARLVDGEKEAGRYSIRWDGSNHASGMYFLRMTATSESGKTLFNKSEKLVLVK